VSNDTRNVAAPDQGVVINKNVRQPKVLNFRDLDLE